MIKCTDVALLRTHLQQIEKAAYKISNLSCRNIFQNHNIGIRDGPHFSVQKKAKKKLFFYKKRKYKVLIAITNIMNFD